MAIQRSRIGNNHIIKNCIVMLTYRALSSLVQWEANLPMAGWLALDDLETEMDWKGPFQLKLFYDTTVSNNSCTDIFHSSIS